MIKTVIRCPDDTVMVFDSAGEQMPEYQGKYREVKKSIMRDTPPDAVFGYLFDSCADLREVERGDW